MAFRKTTIASLWLLLATSGGFLAQGGDKFKVRLAPAPALDAQGRGIQGGAAAVTGIGSATATWNGKKLAVNGTFEKMVSPPTTAKIGLGVATGARGDLIIDLTVTKSPQSTAKENSGTIAGSVDLTPAQVQALRSGKLYIQVNSEGAPNGHLLGWLLR